jgi:predicted transcriptional regulator
VHNHPYEAAAAGLLANPEHEAEALRLRHVRLKRPRASRLDITDRVLLLRENGLTIKQIAQEIGCSQMPIRRVLKEAGLSKTRRRKSAAPTTE